MIKKTASLLLFAFFIVQTSISAQKLQQQETFLLETELIENDGFFDVKTTVFTFKKLDKNHRIVAFSEGDFLHLQSFFNQQDGVLNVSGHRLDKTLEVTSLLEKDGQPLFDHCSIVEDLNSSGYITIRLRSRIKSEYLIASMPMPIPSHEMTAELLEQENKIEDCNECGEVKVSKEALELLKGMDFGGELFNINTDSTSLKSKPSTDMK